MEARVRELLSGRGVVEEKKLMGKLAFLVDGAMCCSVGDEGLLVRVDAREGEALLAMSHVTTMELGARTMTGFVRVAPPGIRTNAMLAKWLERGIAAASAKQRSKSSSRR